MLLQDLKKPHEYLVTSYGGDPTGNSDSTEALLAAMADAAKGPSKGFLMNGIIDLGGAQINLQGGNYLISKPLQFPMAGVGNLMVFYRNHSMSKQNTTFFLSFLSLVHNISLSKRHQI